MFSEITYDVSDLPQAIQDAFTHEKSVLTIWIDYNNRMFGKDDGNVAAYVDSADGNPIELIAIKGDFAKNYLRYDPDEIDYYIAHLRDNLEHEMTHMLQYRALDKLDPRYQEKEKHKGGTKGYYMSQKEFDPQIKSAIFDFQNTMRLQDWMKGREEVPKGGFKDERDAIDTFVGIKPAEPGSLWHTNNFFGNLKQNNPRFWKIAVKKFVAALHDPKHKYYGAA